MDDHGTITGKTIRNAALMLRAEVAGRTATRRWFTVQDVVERLDHRVDADEVETVLRTMAERGLLTHQPDRVSIGRFSPPETLRSDRGRSDRRTARTNRR